MSANDLLMLIAAVVVAVMLILVVRWRRRGHGEHVQQLADDMVCEHLQPAWELLKSRGHHATRVGQKHPDLPLEIHTDPAFDPAAVFEELQLEAPVYLSERNVLYCKEDWCEIHPKP
jgi:hypothetical protein